MHNITLMTTALSHVVEADLREAVSRGQAPSYPLTLTGIATHFDISIQPVRTAVEVLLEECCLLRSANGRLAMNPAKRGNAAVTPPSGDALGPDLNEALEQLIIRYSLKGEEVFLREEETAEQMGVGRTVLRSALTRISGRGLLEHVPRRGWRVAPYDKPRMLDYLDIRESLELKALDVSKGRLDVCRLETLLERNTPTSKGKTQIDDSLHAYWVECSGNRFIASFFEQHGAYHSALFSYASLAGAYVTEMAAQHHTILTALLEQDYGQARRCLRRHIRLQRPNVARLLKLAAAGAMDS